MVCIYRCTNRKISNNSTIFFTDPKSLQLIAFNELLTIINHPQLIVPHREWSSSAQSSPQPGPVALSCVVSPPFKAGQWKGSGTPYLAPWFSISFSSSSSSVFFPTFPFFFLGFFSTNNTAGLSAFVCHLFNRSEAVVNRLLSSYGLRCPAPTASWPGGSSDLGDGDIFSLGCTPGATLPGLLSLSFCRHQITSRRAVYPVFTIANTQHPVPTSSAFMSLTSFSCLNRPPRSGHSACLNWPGPHFLQKCTELGTGSPPAARPKLPPSPSSGPLGCFTLVLNLVLANDIGGGWRSVGLAATSRPFTNTRSGRRCAQSNSKKGTQAGRETGTT